MYCPYCNKEMELGTIQADNLLSWTPNGHIRRGSTRWAISPNGIKLANYSLLSPASLESYYCPDCRKILIDLDKDK